MRTAIVIPARYASTRLPGKPLLRSTGKYLIQHVYERACQSRVANEVMVATDDSRIEAAVKSFHGRCIMTRRDHVSGTDRIAEVASQINFDCIINLQGDEPEIEPDLVDQLPALLQRDPAAAIATLAVPIHDDETFYNPNCVKVVRGRDGRALYFSRSPIPCVRAGKPDYLAQQPLFLRHLGIYAYRRDALLQISALLPDPVEQIEGLEQLRPLSRGWLIQVGIVAHESRGVDTYEDYARFVAARRRPQTVQAQAA